MDEHRIFPKTRRTVLAGIAAALAPGALLAQQRDAMRRLGVLMSTFRNDPEEQAYAAALRQGLGALGWHEGDNLRIDWRWTGGDPALYESYAAELAALGPDVLVASGSSAVEALRRQSRTIPIVFALVADPVDQGLVESLAHPGANVTGFSSFDSPMASKWLAMLTQISPPVARAAILYDPTTSPFAALMLGAIEQAAPSLKVAVRAAPCRDDADIEAMMAGLAREEHGGVLVQPGQFGDVHRSTIVTVAARLLLPAVYPTRLFAMDGGLMSYGTDQPDLFRRAATYVDRILKGAKAGELPVQRPTKFELVINLKTAKALGITITPSLLYNADEVIE